MLNLKKMYKDAEINYRGKPVELMSELTIMIIETIEDISEKSNIKYDDLLTPFLLIMTKSKKGR